jgi:alpha-L-arabinofuranosidase B-like protein
MYLHSVLKGLVVGSAVSLLLLLSQLSYAQEPTSFRAWNYPDRYIRHRLSLGYIDPIVASDKLGRKDATFQLVPGLAGRCRSFESVNYPGHFLRHQNFRLKLAERTDEQLFKEDATFCVVSGLANSEGRSFESVNFPKHYIRHSNFELWLGKSDGSQLFQKDATFIMSPPLTLHPPAGPIDPGTNLVPAEPE